ncbi:MAG TPA: phage tail tape measure protein, partial [Jiangellaceae bacterium]|nr:phage tail tape measure protein [Jiangellaceae bacterium]
IKGAGPEADKSGKLVGGRFGKAVLAGTAVIAGGAVLAGKALYGIGSAFDDVRDNLRAGTGATGADLDAFVENVKNVGRVVPAEFGEIGDVVGDLNTRLDLTGPTLEQMTEQILNLGRVMGEEVDVESMSHAFRQFNVETDDMSDSLDLAYNVSQTTGIGVNQLMSDLQRAAPAAANLGLSFDEAAVMTGNLHKAGMDAGRMMERMTRNLGTVAKAGESPRETFDRVTQEIGAMVEAGDEAGAMELAKSAWGSRAGEQFVKGIQDGTLAIDELTDISSVGTDTIAETAAETMDFSEQWQLFKNRIISEIEPAATALFDAIGDGMEWIADTGVPALKDMGDWLQRNSAWLLPIAAGIGAVVAALTTWVAVSRAWQAIMKAKIAIQTALNAVMAANPIGIIVLALMGLVAALVVAWNHSETFRNIVTGAWEGIKSAASAVWDWMKKAFQWIKDGIASVGDWFKRRGDDIENVWRSIQTAMGKAWNWIKVNVFAPIKRGINLVKMGFDAAGDGISAAWDGIKNALKAGWNWIDDNVFSPFRNGLDRLVGWVGDAGDNIASLWESVKSAFAAPINWVIRNAWNNGLLRAINAVARVIPGVSEISPLPEIQTRAKGGYTPPGWTLVGEEGPELVNFTHPNRVYTAEETRAMLAGYAPNPMVNQFTPSNPPHGGIGGWFSDRWDDVKSAGRWVADGVRDAAGNVVKWARGGLAKAAEIVLNPIRSLIRSSLGSGEGFLGELLSGAGTLAIDKLLEWLRDEDEGSAPDAGGRSLRGAQPHVNNAAWALADAVGGIRTMQAFNQSMAGGHPAGKAVDFIDSVSKLNRLADLISGGGHFDNFNYMAWQGRLWSPGRGWRPQGRGYGNDPMHRWHLHAEWFDQGGFLKPGMGMYANATGRPEPVLTAGQWRDISTLAARGAAFPEHVTLVDESGAMLGRMRVVAQHESQRALVGVARRAR